jgi:hypothetical protein
VLSTRTSLVGDNTLIRNISLKALLFADYTFIIKGSSEVPLIVNSASIEEFLPGKARTNAVYLFIELLLVIPSLNI